MLVSQVLRAKGDLVFTASPRDSVDAVAAMLNTRRVGAIVVVDGERDVVGIVSERDIVRIIAEAGSLGAGPAGGRLHDSRRHLRQADGDRRRHPWPG